MAYLRTKFLSKDEEDVVHGESLRCLREVGVRIQSPGVLAMVEKAGGEVDRKREVGRISEGMVQDALRKAPKRIRYCARDPGHDFVIPTENVPFTATNGLAVHIADLETGEDHSSTKEDLAAFSRLADALDPIDYLWTSLTATDAPERAQGVHNLWVTLQNTVKHVESSRS